MPVVVGRSRLACGVQQHKCHGQPFILPVGLLRLCGAAGLLQVLHGNSRCLRAIGVFCGHKFQAVVLEYSMGPISQHQAGGQGKQSGSWSEVGPVMGFESTAEQTRVSSQ